MLTSQTDYLQIICLAGYAHLSPLLAQRYSIRGVRQVVNVPRPSLHQDIL